MREFRVRAGKYKGDYKVYFSKEELLEEIPQANIKRWPEDHNEMKIGDWVEAEDGYFLELLDIKRPFLKKELKNPSQITKVYHFCNGSAYTYSNSKGKVFVRKFYGMFAYTDRHSLSQDPLKFDIPIDIKVFVELINNGMGMIEAYYTALSDKKRTINKQRAKVEIIKLFRNKRIMEEFGNKIPKALKNLREEFDGDWLLDEYKLALKEVKKGSKDHINLIKEINLTTGLIDSLRTPLLPQKTKELPEKTEEADFEDISEFENVPLPKDDD